MHRAPATAQLEQLKNLMLPTEQLYNRPLQHQQTCQVKFTMSSNPDGEQLIQGNENCLIFMDATPPICGVLDRVGQRCEQCRRAFERAQRTFNRATSNERCQLLQRETANLTAVNEHFGRARENARAETAAWRLATEDVERQREALSRQRVEDEAQLAEIMARKRRSDEEHQQ